MRPELCLPPRDPLAEQALTAELHAIEELLSVDHDAALARLSTLAERTGHSWCDEAVVWAHASNAEETLIELALPPAPRLDLSRQELIAVVRAWWSASREGFDPRAETWFSRVLEANLVHPQKVRGATSPEDFVDRALALPPEIGLPCSDPRRRLRDAVASWLAANRSFDTLFDHVERAGASLGGLFDALTELDDDANEGDEVWALRDRIPLGQDDAVVFFVSHLGVERTQRVVDDSSCRGLDVREHLARLEARADAMTAVASAPITVAYASVIACDPYTRHSCLVVLARTRSMRELVALAAILEDRDAAVVRDSLVRRAMVDEGHVLQASTSALVVEAIESSWTALPPEEVLVACARLFGIAPTDDEPALALLEKWNEASRHARHSLASATTFAARHLAPEQWLPQLRGVGLRASTAALQLLDADETVHRVVRDLLGAGYADDDVYYALRSNGVASVDTLTILRDSGWELDRMVDVLADRGELPTEVRDRLRALGLADHEVLALLSTRWDRETIAVVLRREA